MNSESSPACSEVSLRTDKPEPDRIELQLIPVLTKLAREYPYALPALMELEDCLTILSARMCGTHGVWKESIPLRARISKVGAQTLGQSFLATRIADAVSQAVVIAANTPPPEWEIH